MIYNRIIGLVLLIIGVVFLYFSYQGSESVSDQIQKTFTGKFSDSTMVYLIIGGIMTVCGVILTLRRGR